MTGKLQGDYSPVAKGILLSNFSPEPWSLKFSRSKVIYFINVP